MNNENDLNNFDKITKKLKRQSIYLIVVGFFVIAVFVAYALLNFDITLFGEKPVEISTCTLDLNFKEQNGINLLNAAPIEDNKIVEYAPFIVTIKNNNSNCGSIDYKIKIIDLCQHCDLTEGLCAIGSTTLNCNEKHLIDPNLIKYEIKNTSTGQIKTGTNPFDLEVTNTLAAGNTQVIYEIKLWISSEATKNDLYVHNGCTTTSGITDCNWDYNQDGTYQTRNFGAKVQLDV